MGDDKRLSNIQMAGQEPPRMWGTTIPLSEPEKYRGQFLGTGRFKGECAAGVQHVFFVAGKPLPLTPNWKPGKKVRGNNIRPGTAIASFSNGRYRGNHAAILIAEQKDGLLVWDQYNTPKKAWSPRLLEFREDNDYSNNGNLFYTIEY